MLFCDLFVFIEEILIKTSRFLLWPHPHYCIYSLKPDITFSFRTVHCHSHCTQQRAMDVMKGSLFSWAPCHEHHPMVSGTSGGGRCVLQASLSDAIFTVERVMLSKHSLQLTRCNIYNFKIVQRALHLYTWAFWKPLFAACHFLLYLNWFVIFLNGHLYFKFLIYESINMN